MQKDQNRFEKQLEEELRRRANELPPAPPITPSVLRRTRGRIARTTTIAVVALGLAGFGAVAVITRLMDVPTTVPGGERTDVGPQEPSNPRIRFDGSFGDLGCTYEGPRSVPADEDITFELTNDGEVDFFVDVLRLAEGKGFEDLVAYVNDPAFDAAVRPEWVDSEGVLLALPEERTPWTRALPPGEYAVACFTTDPGRLWILAPLTAEV